MIRIRLFAGLLRLSIVTVQTILIEFCTDFSLRSIVYCLYLLIQIALLFKYRKYYDNNLYFEQIHTIKARALDSPLQLFIPLTTVLLSEYLLTDHSSLAELFYGSTEYLNSWPEISL